MGFNEDIQSRDTNLFPVVVIDDNIYLSTNSVTLNGQYYSPILLNVPSLKESIDIENRLYKINAVSIQVSNFEHQGVRFSELFENTSLINKKLDIYWVSQSVQSLDDARQIYSGKIHRYDMSDEVVKLTVEDRSQEKLHKDLPIRTLDDVDRVPGKYKNAKVPIVYGQIDGSPCVLSQSPFASDVNIGSDKIILMIDGDERTVFNGDEPLMVYGGKFVTIPSTAEKFNFGGDYNNFNNGKQWDKIGNTIHFLANTYGEGEDVTSYVPLSADMVIAYDKVLPIEAVPANDIELYGGAGEGTPSTMNTKPIYKFSEYMPDNKMITMSGTYVNEHYDQTDDYQGASSTVEYMNHHLGIEPDDVTHFPPTESQDSSQLLANVKMDASTNIDVVADRGYLNYFARINIFNFDSYQGNRIRMAFRMGNAEFYEVFFVYMETGDAAVGTFDSPAIAQQFMRGEIDVDQGYFAAEYDKQGQWLIPGKSGFKEIWMYLRGFDGYDTASGVTYNGYYDDYYQAGFEFEFPYLFVNHYMLLDGMHDIDYFANVIGRLGVNSTMPNILNDIMASELNESNLIGSGLQEYDDWYYDFTISKKINSKKLIENLSAVSPYIPHYNNLNNFKFDVIRTLYSGSEENTLIESSDCIKWSYKRTKVEDVKTAIEYQYNENYSTEAFDGIVKYKINDLGIDYSHEFYGLDVNDLDSKLLIDDERSKFIRNKDTAEKFAKWLLYWNCNQHLLIKTRLPLKYLEIEVGSLVTFSNVLGDGVLPYNIDYKASASKDGYYGDFVNGQQVFPMFLCISTNKTLEYVEIEVVQLHNLTSEAVPVGAILGVMNSSAWNHDPNATFNYGREITLATFLDEDVCVLQYHPDNPEMSSTNFSSDINVTDYVGGAFSLPFSIYQTTFTPDQLDQLGEIEQYWKDGGTPRIFSTDGCAWDYIPPLITLKAYDFEDNELDVLGGYIGGNTYQGNTYQNNPYTDDDMEFKIYGKHIENYNSTGAFKVKLELFINPVNDIPTFNSLSITLEVEIGGEIQSFTSDIIVDEENNKVEFDLNIENWLTEAEIESFSSYLGSPDYGFVKNYAPFEPQINFIKGLGVLIENKDTGNVLIQEDISLKFHTTNPLDFTQNGMVTDEDTDIVSNYIMSGSAYNPIYDIDNTGFLGVQDIVLMSNWVLIFGDD